MTRVVIGITAHNEERNLGRLLERLRETPLPADVGLLRMVVVMSGCTDGSVAIAQRAAERDPRLRLVVDPERRGKAVAINQLLDQARDADLIVMESADTLPDPGAIAALLAPFADAAVGMVGARPVPEDDESTFLGFANQLMWRLHHEVASVSPKQGELVAWRNVVDRIPEDVAMDEAYLEAEIVRRGYRLAYAPDAVVRNRGAATIRAFIAQRRRNHAGHRLLAARYHYRPATRDRALLARVALREMLRERGRLRWFFMAALLETWCRVLGWWDYAIAHRDHRLWQMIDGTKELAAATVGQEPVVAAVVVTHNGRANALECVASLERNAYPGLRTIVVDNGTDGAAEAVCAAHAGVDALTIPNRGLAQAFNAGVRAAAAHAPKYVLQVSDDVVVATDFVRAIVGAAEADPRAGAIQGPIYRYDDPERIWAAGGEVLWVLGKTYQRGREMLDGPIFRRARPVGYTCGAAVLYRMDALRAVGGWDEDYFLVFEDSDWSVRAARAGWRQLYHPAPKAWHKVSQSFGGEKSPLYLYFLFRNNVRFMLKLGRPWQLPTFLAFFVLESLVRYSIEALVMSDTRARLRAIWLATLDALRGRYGRGSLDALLPRSPVSAVDEVTPA